MFLATKLGMTVSRLREELAADEYMRWGVYFARKAHREELKRLQAEGGAQ
jgi:hypothetical protein